jgi:hypothetical protein
MPDDKFKEPCKKYACAIQDCLNKNKFNQEKCEDAIEAMRECCRNLKTYSFICQGMIDKENTVG